MIPHQSVLLNEVVAAFQGLSLETFIDGTIGAGGHAESILRDHPEIVRLIGLDQDPKALEIATQRLDPWRKKLHLHHCNFESFAMVLDKEKIPQVEGFLLDLGVSSMQLDSAEKGFSFMRDGPLDMRMNPQNAITAAAIVNTWTERELGRIFRDYGEEKRWRLAARILIQAREHKKIETTRQLVEILEPVLRQKSHKEIHPLTLVFQALRIAVNRELEVIENVLPKAIDRLSPGGRLAVITFHSLEDRIVKNAFRFAASDKFDTRGIGGLFMDKEPIVKIVTKKPIIPSDEEIRRNPRSRSAKLRIVEKLC